jgi:DNA (cytosine-5)-methyltransferase 1
VKILNLYAGIGGNRKLWGDKHEIVAVENDPAIAEVYKDHFPNDTVIVGDAHEYLRQHFKEFDFIWSSPPCQTHSGIRQNIGVRCRGVEPKFPNMVLYEEILFLMYNAECAWVVENVRP